MTERGKFDLLVSGLSPAERQDLLEKLTGQGNITTEPLYIDEISEEHILGIQEMYAQLPGHSRFWLFILSLFQARPPVKIFEDQQIARIGREINRSSPLLFDYKQGRLLALFHTQVEKLKNASHFFFTALDAGFNQDKGAFFGFLGSLEMPNAHNDLEACADPESLSDYTPGASEKELRQAALKNMEDVMTSLSEELRDTMYDDIRYLYCLQKLVAFPFNRLLKSFSLSPGIGGYSCYVAMVTGMLSSLNDILHSLRDFPPMPLLESLFIFLLQEKSQEGAMNTDTLVRMLLRNAEESLQLIREFNRQVPLTKILRCAERNITLSPREVSGGEDWLVVYREYWRRRLEDAFAEYRRSHRKQKLAMLCGDVLNGTAIQPMANVATEANPTGIPLKGSFCISFLAAFYYGVFMGEINKILEPIFIYGEFYHKDNRNKFMESYNDLIKLEDDIRAFETKISPNGIIGRQFIQAMEDVSDPRVKRRKVLAVTEEASRDASLIVASARQSSQTMAGILEGILKYDTLSKIPKLLGPEQEFMGHIDFAVKKFQTVLQILDEGEALENET
ncbi:MAG: DUF5312 domain-containing protein [Spirochaetaceae bacterium]|jgi:hypothetical protein|nr:DUF5312 domain-containing protein [Spirochaetaceae bacterium]